MIEHLITMIEVLGYLILIGGGIFFVVELLFGLFFANIFDDYDDDDTIR